MTISKKCSDSASARLAQLDRALASGADAFASGNAEIGGVSANVLDCRRRFAARLDLSGPVPSHAPELGPCHLWTGSVGKDGYGRTSLGGRKQQAHRATWLLAHGSIPDGQVIRHRCDTKLCCRLEHLLPGTHQQNADDASERGRLKGVHVQSRLKPGLAPPDDGWMTPWLVQGSELPTRPMVRDALPKRRRTLANAHSALAKLLVRRKELGVTERRRVMPHEIAVTIDDLDAGGVERA